jgi:hypothetical protein
LDEVGIHVHEDMGGRGEVLGACWGQMVCPWI